jgi:hypothetical protein
VSPAEARKRTLVVPPPAEEITPEIARRWLRDRLGPYMEIAAAGALADDLDTREALHFLVLDVRTIADACVLAVVTGQISRLELCSRDDDPASFDDETETLRSVVGAQAMILEKWGDNAQIRRVFEELARALAERERAARSWVQ